MNLLLNHLPKTFRFSPTLTLCSLLLAAVMIWCSQWQWQRYKFKVSLVETYKNNSTSPSLNFPASDNFESVLNRKVEVSGSYDYSHQIIIANRKNKVGPGYWLMTPLKLKDDTRSVLVSRGFIPYADAKREDWEKYSFVTKETFQAVVQPTVAHRSPLAPEPKSELSTTWSEKWLYPDLEKIAKQFPYPIITSVYLQRLGGPPNGYFPAESVTIEVPPSTHFWYSIEWVFLACGTLTISFLLQAYPRSRARGNQVR